MNWLLGLILLAVSSALAAPSQMVLFANASPPPCPGCINITVTGHQYNYNLFTAAGSPGGVVTVNLTINSGIVLYGHSPSGTAGLYISGFASGSTITVTNNGWITGGGGGGGAGGDGTGTGNQNGLQGLTGYAAIVTFNAIRIDNTSGYILGGGGGGGGGAASWLGGGGGGGGMGNIAAPGGAGGPGYVGYDGSAGSPGSDGAGGAGGAGSTYQEDGGDCTIRCYGGTGGTGGAWGLAGATGTYSTPPFAPIPGTGGAPGNAIHTNGYTITWLGGNNSTQVKGIVGT